jgi:prepilin-type N-terminal cleavage/methylation domain-containing protein
MGQQRAFTLVEMLLVLALIVALAAVATPSIYRTLEHQQLKYAADQLRAICGDARIAAMRTGQMQLLRFEAGGSRYYIQPWVAGDDTLNASLEQSVQLQTEPGVPANIRMRTLPEKVTFHFTEGKFDTRAAMVEQELTNAERGDVTWSRPLLFYADGTSSQARILLVNAREQGIEILLQGIVGTAKIGNVALITSLEAENTASTSLENSSGENP